MCSGSVLTGHSHGSSQHHQGYVEEKELDPDVSLHLLHQYRLLGDALPIPGYVPSVCYVLVLGAILGYLFNWPLVL